MATLSPPHLAEASPQSTFFKARIADAYPPSHITPQVQCPLLVPLTASTNKVPLEERLSSQPNSTAQNTSRWTGPRRRSTPSSPPRFSLHLHALARHARLASPSIDLMGGGLNSVLAHLGLSRVLGSRRHYPNHTNLPQAHHCWWRDALVGRGIERPPSMPG